MWFCAVVTCDDTFEDDLEDAIDHDFDGDPRKSVSKAQAIETSETLRPVQSRSSCGSG